MSFILFTFFSSCQLFWISILDCVLLRSFMATSGTYTGCLLLGSLQTKSVRFSVTSRTIFALARLKIFTVEKSGRGIFLFCWPWSRMCFSANKDRAKRQLFDNRHVWWKCNNKQSLPRTLDPRCRLGKRVGLSQESSIGWRSWDDWGESSQLLSTDLSWSFFFSQIFAISLDLF